MLRLIAYNVKCKNWSDMKRDMEDILLDLIDGDIGIDKAKEELLFLNSVSNTLFVCMDKDDDILSVHRTEKGAVSKRKELLKEYLKIGVFKMELLE